LPIKADYRWVEEVPGKRTIVEECQEMMGPVEKHQFLLAASFANPDGLDKNALANWTFSAGPMSCWDFTPR
jgi:hypothetical protein